ncbi:MAG TPA: 3-hexulose-6-phosphate synthase [Pseudogracilibacillus sp.]|uniref:3-hexulose-6-phosphate synthase n=1 Tax=Candidatus Pseudogracilibacillus intestinigallinarum TaxID=2838742 RepID=A0A9D1PLN0_9BACI|nr:orotidine 5'-phosphate decarboxylase [Candidatus Pseudogracilibacillus intestinigallinarum]HLR41809.1 3-hexulose-6-phosphate synthase [Pseudogracilibacillus sp.]
MLIQIALDRMTEKEAFSILDMVAEEIDVIEIGTGVIKQYGMSIVKKIKNQYPNILLFADMKTCDAGESEAIQAFQAGADITSCMAFSSVSTIEKVLQTATKYDKEVMIDLLGVQDVEKINDLYGIGCRYFCLHIGIDEQKESINPLSNLYDVMTNLKSCKIAVAGGITPSSLSNLDFSLINIVIVGSAITKSTNPLNVVQCIKRKISN